MNKKNKEELDLLNDLKTAIEKLPDDELNDIMQRSVLIAECMRTDDNYNFYYEDEVYGEKEDIIDTMKYEENCDYESDCKYINTCDRACKHCTNAYDCFVTRFKKGWFDDYV